MNNQKHQVHGVFLIKFGGKAVITKEIFMPSVLIIEDREKMRKSLVNAFKRRHYEACKGVSWENAVEFLYKEVYDVVVVDLEVKKQAGYDMLKTIRRSNANAEIIAVFDPKEYDKDSVMSNGVYDYVFRPFLPDDVVRIGVKALEKKRLSDKVRNLEQIRDMDKFALS